MGFQDAVMTGLAPDGGLLLPSAVPAVSPATLAAWRGLSYPELAIAVLRLYTDLPEADLDALVRRSYAVFRHADVTPVVPVGDRYVLELFHGPTLAFKDIALQVLGNLFARILAARDEEMNIVAATSGDTGSAAIQGVRGKPRIRIFVMHPDGRTSRTQALQMTSVLDPNVHNLAVQGTFDDCQSILKSLFRDLPFKQAYHLGAVNSINWARVLAQIVYYFYGAFRVMDATGCARVRFTVPTGNFGDIFAGYLAARMGLPIDRLVLATNENDILFRFFETGVYCRGAVQPTLSPSMDIQVASNFERYLYYRMGGATRRVCDLMEAFRAEGRFVLPPDAGAEGLMATGRGDSAATLRTIGDCYARFGYLLDPHTAVGYHVAGRHLDADIPMICLATAHPAKFGDAIRQATGQDLAHHPLLDALEGAATRCTTVPATLDAVRACVVREVEAAAHG